MPEWRLALPGEQKYPKKAKAAGTIELLVPPNGAPGATIRAESSTGPIDVQVPAGAGPHSFFEVQDPSHGKVTVRFEVPATVAAGELVRVPRPGGELVSVRVPPGAKPGEWVAVQLGANYAPANALTDEVSPAHVSLTERVKGNAGCGDSDVSDLNQHKGGCFCVDTCCGIPCFCLKTNRQRADLILKKFSPTPVDRAAPGGVVKVNGRVVATGGHLRAPCSGRKCVYYEVRVEQWVSSEEFAQWMPVVRVVKGIDFGLEAGGVTCHVDQVPAGLRAASGFDYFVGGRVTADGQSLKDVSCCVPPELYEQIEEWKRRAYGCVKSWADGVGLYQGGLRVSEKAFVVGEPLACCGRLERQGGKLILSAATRDAVPKEERSRWTSNERRAWHELLEPANACGPKDFWIAFWIGCFPFGVNLTCCDCHRFTKGKRGPAVLASSDPSDLDSVLEGGGAAPETAAMAERETEVMVEGVVVGV